MGMAQQTTPQISFYTRPLRIMILLAALIFSQNMFTVSSQIAVGDWEFWTDWKDFSFYPFVISWIVSTHMPIYSYVFWRFFGLYGGATMTTLFWMAQRYIMIYLFFEQANLYPFSITMPPIYFVSAIASDLTLLVLKQHKGLFVLTAAIVASAVAVPANYLFLNQPFLMMMVSYPDPLKPEVAYTLPVWYLIRMIAERPPIPAYISMDWTWFVPYRSFYDIVTITTGNAAVFGSIWAGFTYIFLWGILRGYDAAIKYFKE